MKTALPAPDASTVATLSRSRPLRSLPRIAKHLGIGKTLLRERIALGEAWGLPFPGEPVTPGAPTSPWVVRDLRALEAWHRAVLDRIRNGPLGGGRVRTSSDEKVGRAGKKTCNSRQRGRED